MVQRMILLVVLLAFSALAASQNVVYFNASANCPATMPCNMADSTIWIGGVPNYQTAVIINGNSANMPYIILNAQMNLTFLSLSVENANLNFQTSLTINNGMNFTNVVCNVADNVALTVLAYTDNVIFEGTMLTISAGGFCQLGNLTNAAGYFMMNENVSITVNGLFQIWLYQSYFYGLLSIPNPAAYMECMSINATYAVAPASSIIGHARFMNVFFYEQLMFNGILSVDKVATFTSNATVDVNRYFALVTDLMTNSLLRVHQQPNVSIIPPTPSFGNLTGSGSLAMFDNSAIVTVESDFVGTITLGGFATLLMSGILQAQNVMIGQSEIGNPTQASIIASESYNISLTILSPNPTVPFMFNVSLGANSPTDLYLNGSFILSGSLQSTDGNVFTTGDITASGIGFYGTHGIWTLLNNQSTTITAPNFILQGTLDTGSAAYVTLNTNLTNSGSILTSNTVFMSGYQQTTSGVLQINNLIAGAAARVYVSGPTSLAGKLAYSIGDNVTTASKYWVMHVGSTSNNTANGTIAGEFQVLSAVSGSVKTMEVDKSLSTVNDVYLKYPGTKGFFAKLTWWMWTLIGVGAVVVLVVLILAIRACTHRKRSEYKPL